jgi:hypothetical protein
MPIFDIMEKTREAAFSEEENSASFGSIAVFYVPAD